MNNLILLKVNFVFFLFCLCESALSPEIRKAYSGLLSGNGLYVEEDDIVILNATNYKSTLYDKSNAWLVEFYNSWCGHCHKFAPVWKSLAANLYEWRNVIQLAAIDCAHEDHTSICRDYEIMAYPTIKFFAAYSPPSHLGTEIVRLSQSEEDITREVVGILQKEQLEGRGSRWPNIIPYRSYDTTSLWKGAHKLRYVFLIFADGNNPLATEVILDLCNVKGIEIRGVVPENEVLSKLLGVSTYPSLLVIESANSEPQFLHPKDTSREAYRLAIKSFLKKKGIAVPNEPKTIKRIAPQELPSLMELQEAREALVELTKIKELGDVVFLVDLENALRYSLEHEIPLKKSISGESFRALKNYLKVLNKYFPMKKTGENYMQKLQSILSSENEIKGLKFKSYLANLSRDGLESALSTKENWKGCMGSEKHFRGYPCGLWTLFHYMTVNALRDSYQPHFDPLEVLEAMVGYITYFFGCTSCSKHFQQMVLDKAMKTKVTSAEEAILWLWSAHNEVNQRLAKDESEDPMFPKIQFPSQDRCPNCRNANGDWNHESVLNHLISVYSQDNLNQLGAEVKINFPNKSYIYTQKKPGFLVKSSKKKISKDFNIFDISLCVVLYIVSAIICIGVCLKFFLKKRHRKKSYGIDLLGKV